MKKLFLVALSIASCMSVAYGMQPQEKDVNNKYNRVLVKYYIEESCSDGEVEWLSGERKKILESEKEQHRLEWKERMCRFFLTMLDDNAKALCFLIEKCINGVSFDIKSRDQNIFDYLRGMQLISNPGQDVPDEVYAALKLFCDKYFLLIGALFIKNHWALWSKNTYEEDLLKQNPFSRLFYTPQIK